MWSRGARRSAEISTTSLPSWARTAATFDAIVLFPSPARALVTFYQDGVEDTPVGAHETEIRGLLETLSDRAQLLPRHLAGMHVADALGLVHLRGDEERGAGGTRSCDPYETIAATVEVGDEPLGRRPGLWLRRGRRARFGKGDTALLQAIERESDLFPGAPIVGMRLERDQ